MTRRIPKRGFNSKFKKDYALINLDQLEKYFKASEEVTPETLLARRVIDKIADGVKVLGRGELKKSLTVKASAYSGKAKEMIEKAGGKAEVISS